MENSIQPVPKNTLQMYCWCDEMTCQARDAEIVLDCGSAELWAIHQALCAEQMN